MVLTTRAGLEPFYKEDYKEPLNIISWRCYSLQ